MARRERRAERGGPARGRRFASVDATGAAETDAAAAGTQRGSTAGADTDLADPWAGLPSTDRVLHTHAAAHNRGRLDAAIDAAEVEVIEAAQDAADRAIRAEIEAELAEADLLYGADPHEHLAPGTPVPGVDLAVDAEQWEASLAVLRASGYEIGTATSPDGATDVNGTAYWLDADAALNQPGIREEVDQNVDPVDLWLVIRAADGEAAEVDRHRRDHAEPDQASLERTFHAGASEGDGPSLGPSS